jgi:FkbM family methyltransferase
MAPFDPERDHIEQGWAKKEFGLLHYRLQGLSAQGRAALQGDFTQALLQDALRVDTPHGPLAFVLMGGASGGRATRVLDKQPATIAWIDTFAAGSVFWDVGANVGVYTLYAAQQPGIKVVAIEPAAVNYFLLTANCEINNMNDRVDCLLLGLGSATGIARLEVSQFEPAHSFSFIGKTRQPRTGRQAAIIESMDRLIADYALPCPNYIKIDVPGMTDDIFAGAAQTLQRTEVRQLHIEVRIDSKSGQRIADLLGGYGFRLTGGAENDGGGSDVTFSRE